MKFGIFDVIVFYKFVDEVAQEHVGSVLDRLRENENIYVCPNSYPELGLVSTDITLHSLTLGVEEIGAALFDAMDGNVVFGTRKELGKHNVVIDKLKIRYDFYGNGSEEYVKALYNFMPNGKNNFIHYGDSSLYIWTKLDVEGATDLVLSAIEKMDEPACLV